MRRGFRWYLVSNALLVGPILALILLWQTAEAPQKRVESGNEPSSREARQESPAQVPAEVMEKATALAAPAEEANAMAASPAGAVRELAAPPAEPTTVATVPAAIERNLPVARVPILMYHRIDWLPPNPDAIRRSLSISPSEFDSQVRFLKERGFASISLYELYEALQGKRVLPPKPVILTFDDGYADNYANAFPILQRYGFVGTFFILTDVTGTGEYMSWEQLKEMAAAGMKIEVHGRTHLDLTKMTPAGIANQARGAREAIQARLGLDPKFYCYPSGKYDDQVIEIVRANGYLGAVTVNYGSEHSLQKAFELKRVRIDGRESSGVFARKVEG